MNPEIIHYNQLQFLKAEPTAPLALNIVANVGAVIINYPTHSEVCVLLQKICYHHDQKVYLTPFFLHNLTGNMDQAVIQLTDGVLTNLSNLDPAVIVVGKIQSRMSQTASQN